MPGLPWAPPSRTSSACSTPPLMSSAPADGAQTPIADQPPYTELVLLTTTQHAGEPASVHLKCMTPHYGRRMGQCLTGGGLGWRY